MNGPFVGDFLVGLFALSREELGRSEALLSAIVGGVEDMSAHGFLIALPSMRQAFDYFPPRERADLAERLLERYGLDDKGPDTEETPED